MKQTEDSSSETQESYVQAVLNGFRYAIQRPPVRLSLIVIAALNFAAIGPTIIGTAILVEQRFKGDASMYGIILSAYGVGGLIGALIAGRIGSVQRPGRVLIVTASAVGVSLIGTGLAPSFGVAFVIQAISGIAIGCGMPFFSAWLQGETELHMQGRVSSLVAFSAVAVDPFSQGIAGIVSQFDVTLLFVAAGGLMVITAWIVYLNPAAHIVVESVIQQGPDIADFKA